MTDKINFTHQVAACDQRTQQLLSDAGWFPDRQVDISQDIKELEAEGYTVFPSVQRFLLSFNGLDLQWSIFDTRSGRDLHTDVWIDGAAVAGALFSEWRSDYEAFLGTSVCPIGKAEHGHFTLLMDIRGQVFGVFDELIVLYGETGVQAIDTLVTRRKPVILREG